jgi:hypothetical protein
MDTLNENCPRKGCLTHKNCDFGQLKKRFQSCFFSAFLKLANRMCVYVGTYFDTAQCHTYTRTFEVTLECPCYVRLPFSAIFFANHKKNNVTIPVCKEKIAIFVK